MKYKFTDAVFQELERVLETKFAKRGTQYRAVLLNSDEGRQLSIEIHPDLQMGEEKGNLISIFTSNSHIQLHFCTGVVASDILGEVTLDLTLT